jgi:hypothetical protein
LFGRSLLSRFWTSPVPKRKKQNAILKKWRKIRGIKKKRATFFVMSPDGLFRVFELSLFPCYETPKKRAKKKSMKKNGVSNYFLLALQQMYVTFVLFFFAPPLEPSVFFVERVCLEQSVVVSPASEGPESVFLFPAA